MHRQKVKFTFCTKVTKMGSIIGHIPIKKYPPPGDGYPEDTCSLVFDIKLELPLHD